MKDIQIKTISLVKCLILMLHRTIYYYPLNISVRLQCYRFCKRQKDLFLFNVHVFCFHCMLRCLRVHGESGPQTEGSPSQRLRWDHGAEVFLCVALLLRGKATGHIFLSWHYWAYWGSRKLHTMPAGQWKTVSTFTWRTSVLLIFNRTFSCPIILG